MSKEKKSKMISMRMTQRQFDSLDHLAIRLKTATGVSITRASIIMKLMEYGLPKLEEQIPFNDSLNKRN